MDAGRDLGAFDEARVSLRAKSEMLRTHCIPRRQSSCGAADGSLDDDEEVARMRQGVVDAQLEFVRCRAEARARDAKRTLRLSRSERSALRALGLLDERIQRGRSRLLLLTLGTRDPHSMLSVLVDDIVRFIMLYLVLNPYDQVAAAAHFAPNSLPTHDAAFDDLLWSEDPWQGGFPSAAFGDLGSDTSSDWSLL